VHWALATVLPRVSRAGHGQEVSKAVSLLANGRQQALTDKQASTHSTVWDHAVLCQQLQFSWSAVLLTACMCPTCVPVCVTVAAEPPLSLHFPCVLFPAHPYSCRLSASVGYIYVWTCNKKNVHNGRSAVRYRPMGGTVVTGFWGFHNQKHVCVMTGLQKGPRQLRHTDAKQTWRPSVETLPHTDRQRCTQTHQGPRQLRYMSTQNKPGALISKRAPEQTMSLNRTAKPRRNPSTTTHTHLLPPGGTLNLHIQTAAATRHTFKHTVIHAEQADTHLKQTAACINW
jgi:hypothetical protein